MLVGGLRMLGTNVGQTGHGVFTKKPGTLSNDYFVNLLDMGVEWKAVSDAEEQFEGRDRNTGELRWTATRVNLIFGSNVGARQPAPLVNEVGVQVMGPGFHLDLILVRNSPDQDGHATSEVHHAR